MPIIYSGSDTKPAPHPLAALHAFPLLGHRCQGNVQHTLWCAAIKKKQPFCKGVPFSRAKALVWTLSQRSFGCKNIPQPFCKGWADMQVCHPLSREFLAKLCPHLQCFFFADVVIFQGFFDLFYDQHILLAHCCSHFHNELLLFSRGFGSTKVCSFFFLGVVL